MKTTLISLGLAAMLVAPAGFAADQKPASGQATGTDNDAYRTQTIVGIGAGVATAGLLIGLAASGGGDEDVTLGTTTTTRTTPTTTTTTPTTN